MKTRLLLTLVKIWPRIVGITLLMAIFLSNSSFGQAVGDYRSRQNGPWGTLNTWERLNVLPGTWVIPTAGQGYPGQNAVPGTVTIQDNHAITHNVSPANNIGSLVIAAGGNASSLTFTGTNSLTVNGAVTINSGTGANDNKTIAVAAGTFSCASISMSTTTANNIVNSLTISTGTVTVSGNLTMLDASTARNRVVFGGGAGTLNVGGNLTGGDLTTVSTSTVNYNGGAAQTAKVTTYSNLTLSGSLAKSFATTPTVNGILSMEGAATISVGGTGVVTYGANATLQYNKPASYTATAAEWITPFAGTGGIRIMGAGAITTFAALTLNAGVPLNIDAGATLQTGANALWTLSVGGPTTVTGTLTLASTAAKTFTGDVTIDGTWNETGVAAINFAGNLTNNATSFTASTGLHTFTGNTKVLSGSTITSIPNTSISGSYTNNGTFTSGTDLAGLGSLTQGATGILNIGGTSGIGTLTATAAGNTVEYNGGAAQIVKDISYSNLVISGSAKTWTLAANRNVGANLTISSGTLTTAGNSPLILVVTGTTSVTGAFILGGTSTKTFTGDVTLNAGAVWNETGIATVDFGGSLSNNATTFTANTGTHNFTGAGKTLSGSTTTVITNAAFAGSYTNDATFTSTATLSGAGSLTQGTTGILNIGGTSALGTLTATAVGNTVDYTGGAQTVKSGNYYHLNLSGSGAKTLATGTTAIGGNFALSGTASTTAVVSLAIGGSVTLGGGTSLTTGAFTHNVGGNWTNNGATNNNAGSMIILDGTAQIIGGTSSTTFDNLALTSSGTKTFSAATFITGNLGINSGVVASLSSFTNHTANTLTLGGTSQAAGTWGGTSSAATNINSTYFATATGILTVAAAGRIYYSRQGGNWNSNTTWSTVTYGNTTNAGTFPGPGDVANIGGGNFTITVNVNSACVSLSFLGNEQFDQSVSLNAGITLNVSGVITIPTGNRNGDINTLAVGAGILNAGALAFTTGGVLGGHPLTISTGTATISGDITQSGANPIAVTFSAGGLLRVGGAFPNYCAFTPSSGTVEYYGTVAQTIPRFATLIPLATYAYNNLTFSGAGVKTAAEDLDVNGAFTLGSGTTFVGGPYTHTVAGNWINNGTSFTNTNTTISFDGAAQNIGGTTATTFNNLTLAGTAGSTKTIGFATAIDGTFAITGVIANLGSFTHTARTLALDGAGQVSGSWGSLGSPATNKTNTYFTAAATGIVNVTNRAYFTRQGGNWNVNTTWSTVTYSDATNSGNFPVAGDIVNIGGGNYGITVNVNSACAILNYEGNTTNSPTVTVNNLMTLTVSGAVNIPSGGGLFTTGTNTLAVGQGTLNAGSIAFSTDGLLGDHALTISTGTANVSGDVTQSGFSDATVNFSSTGSLNLQGAFLNSTNCSFTAGSGTVNYTSTSVAQTIGNFTYYNLTLNNTSGATPPLTLYGDATVGNTLTMTSGNVNLNSSTLTIGTANTSVATIGSLSYASGWMYGGTLRRYFTAGTAVTLGLVEGLFPLGTTSNYRPLYLGKTNVTGAGGALNVSHNGTDNGTSPVSFADDIGTVVLRSNSFWTVSKQSGMNGSGSPYSIEAGGTGFGTIQEVDDLRLTQFGNEVGTTSLPNNGTTASPLVKKVNITGANLAQDYYVASVDAVNTPLPVELLYFRADVYGDAVTTTWATASELNNDYFTIERASNIEEFEVIGLPIDGAGTTKERKDYSIVDEYPLYGRSYYRLRQTDFDGNFTYSDLQVVDYEGPKFAGLRAYPNPSDGHSLTVLVTGLKDQAVVPIQIYNVQGQMVYNGTLDVDTPGTLKHEIEFGNPLRAGVYLIKAGPTLQLTQKIFIH